MSSFRKWIVFLFVFLLSNTCSLAQHIRPHTSLSSFSKDQFYFFSPPPPSPPIKKAFYFFSPPPPSPPQKAFYFFSPPPPHRPHHRKTLSPPPNILYIVKQMIESVISVPFPGDNKKTARVSVCSPSGKWETRSGRNSDPSTALDDSGNVIVFGNVVFLCPEQVAKTSESLISESIANPEDPRRKGLENLERQKALLWAGLLDGSDLWAHEAYLLGTKLGCDGAHIHFLP
ncbi:hypothetical protein VNO77_11307 [Canavalia gladiata]|uniref:Uncharacterized protein n=1 Tax=Canavalia gladiata TaxID=3824 RepID=A0AAN9MGP8_CANGL